MAGIGAVTTYAVSVLFSLLVLGLYILGAARYLTNLEENTCEMTFMFEYPQYVRIALNDDVEERYPRFGLYAYGEGFVTEKLRRMKFSGIPVLFIPGNGGSHEQVRSLASVSLRKSIKDRTSFHFDYFTVSLGKDYSALYGGVLEEETSYVSLCINKILSLYKGKVEKIVLIGHSMVGTSFESVIRTFSVGKTVIYHWRFALFTIPQCCYWKGGIIAKGALLSPFSSGTISNSSFATILVTLASPHRPIFLPDRTISRYYDELDNSTHRLREMGTSVVSIGGGQRDVLVSSSQTIEPSADLNLISSGIPDVWQSTDHLCILWCKKLVLTIVRALFDCVDTNARPPAISSDVQVKWRALSYHFTSRISGKRLRPYEERVEFEGGAEWIEDTRRQYTWTSSGRDMNNTVFLMIRLGFPAYDTLSIESINLEAKDWIFACSAYAIQGNSRVCQWGWNLTNRTSLSPDPTHRLRKSLDLNLDELNDSKMSHVVVRLPVNELRNKKNLVRIHIDLYKRSDRTVHLEDGGRGLADFLSLFRLSRIFSPDPYSIVVSSRGSLRYHIVLDGIEDAVSIDIEPKHEDTSTPTKPAKEDELPQAIFELLEDSVNRTRGQVRTVVLNRKDSEPVRKRLAMHLTRKEAMLRVTLGPEYSYRLAIHRAGIVERVACAVRSRWPVLYPIILALCLLAIATRIDHSPCKTTITIGITLLSSIGLDFLLETFVALGLLHVFAVTTCSLVVFFGSVVHNVAARFFARIAAMPSVWFDWLIGGLDRVPILTTFILLSLISATCGATAILISVPLYFLKLTRMWDEYLEELFMASLRHFIPFGQRRGKRKRRGASGTATSSTALVPAEADAAQVDSGTQQAVLESGKTSRETILNNLLLFVTWSFAAVPAIPSALVWAKNFRYETRLTTEDPTLLISWIVLTGWGSLGLVEIPSSQPGNDAKRRLFCSNILRLIAWLLICTAGFRDSAHYQWIVPPLVATGLSCVALLSLFPGLSTEQTDSTVAATQ